MEGTYVSPGGGPEPKKSNTLLIVVVVIGAVILLCCCCIAAFFFLGPLFLGPTVGNVFSNIIEGLEMTPGY